MQISIEGISKQILDDLQELNFVEDYDQISFGSCENNDRYDVLLSDKVSIHTNTKLWLEDSMNNKYSLDCIDFNEVTII